jgi:hypothetical protein
MLPSQLTAEQFSAYPPEAKHIAANRLDLLQQLPLAFVPLLLRELIGYDWKFPAEKSELDQQFEYLSSLDPDQLRQLMSPFATLQLSSQFQQFDWPNRPGEFSENLTAHLWATHQIDVFRTAAVAYIDKAHAASPRKSPPVPRLGIVIVGQGVAENSYPLFRRLRAHGVYYSNVAPSGGCRVLLDAVAARAAAHPVPYGHWYIDGGTPEVPCPGATSVSWSSLTPVREALLGRIRSAMRSGAGSEALRTMLAEMDPHDPSLGSATKDPVLNRFQISLLTEGSGTQMFSTTFVQWAAREALRRAQPLTLLARFAPRLRELSLGDLISTRHENPPLDAQGALIDADMGAWYTWLNQQRLAGADQLRFLVWFEDHGEALAIAPALKPGTSSEAVDLKGLLERLA